MTPCSMADSTWATVSVKLGSSKIPAKENLEEELTKQRCYLLKKFVFNKIKRPLGRLKFCFL